MPVGFVVVEMEYETGYGKILVAGGNQARKKSDVDLLVEFSRPVGLFQFARLKLYLEKVLGHEVDLVTPEALREELREDILREAIRAA